MTDEQKRLIAELAKQGKFDIEIARIMRVGRESVCRVRRSFGIPAQSKPCLPKEEHKRRYALYKQGLSDAELADACHISKSAATSWRVKNMFPINKKYERGRKPEKVKAIRKGTCCGTCKYWEPSQPEPVKCKRCDHREEWEAV